MIYTFFSKEDVMSLLSRDVSQIVQTIKTESEFRKIILFYDRYYYLLYTYPLLLKDSYPKLISTNDPI